MPWQHGCSVFRTSTRTVLTLHPPTLLYILALAACKGHITADRLDTAEDGTGRLVSLHQRQAQEQPEAAVSARRATSPDTRCPPGCTAHGVCNEELGRCDCLRFFTGPSCASALPDTDRPCAQMFMLDDHGQCNRRYPCFNDCNRRGTCEAGVCHCQPGYWGIDCAISWGPDGKPQLLDGHYKPRKTGVKIYIYELPYNITTWWPWTRQDRPVQHLFWQRITSAGVRTLDGDEADYYFLPALTRTDPQFLYLGWALDYIRRTSPWWSRDGGRRHLAMHTGDMGTTELPEELLADYAEEIANMTWLTHFGLYKAHPLYGTWKPVHRPGKDLVIPVYMASPSWSTTPLNPANVAAARARGRHVRAERTGTLFFAGRICGDSQPPNATSGTCLSTKHEDYSLGVRQAVYLHHHNRTGYRVATHSDTYVRDMATHKFCLAPPGGGYGKRQVLVSLMGCVPVLIGDGVLQPFEPELDWSSFGVSVAEAQIPHLHDILDGMPPGQLSAKQNRLRCIAQHLYYSSSLGALLGDDGRYDAFETVLQILRVRKEHPELPPQRYMAVDEEFKKFVRCNLGGPAEPLPLCTRSAERQFENRPTCLECVEAGGLPRDKYEYALRFPGGMACCGGFDRSTCLRVWQ